MTTATITPTAQEARVEQYQRELAEARELLDRAIAEKGEDFVYSRANEFCLYQEYELLQRDEYGCIDGYATPTGPSCLVGHVAYYRDVDPLKIIDWENQGADDMLTGLGLFSNQEVLNAFMRAQGTQDGGGTWRSAKDSFEGYIRGYEAACRTRGLAAGSVDYGDLYHLTVVGN